MFRKLALTLIAGLLLAGGVLYAQEDPDTFYEVPLWNVIELEDGEPVDPEENTLPLTVAFLSLDEGDTLIAVWAGPDIVYTLNEDGTYAGATLIPEPYEFEATLEVIDETTMQSASVLNAGAFTSETTYRYELSDDAPVARIYTEGERTIEEYSQFQECMGRTDVEVGSAWTTPDLLIPIVVDLEEGLMIWDQREFIGDDGGQGTHVETTEFGTLQNVITRTFHPAGDYAFDFRYHAIAGERDDCEMIYQSTFTPFDGDFEALFARAEELGDTE
jgi:hypothetical protein